MRQLIVLVGNNGTGKTYYSSHKFPQEYIIVRPDDFEGDIQGKQTKMFKIIEQGLADNSTIVLDGLNLEKSQRSLLLYFTRDYDDCKKIIYDFGPGDEQTIEVLAKERPYLTYEEWIRNFNENKKRYEKPSLDEGNDEVIFIKKDVRQQ